MRFIVLSIVMIVVFVCSGFARNNNTLSQTYTEQELVEKKVMKHLELNAVGGVYEYFEHWDRVKPILAESVFEIEKIKERTKLSIVMVLDGEYKVYRCRYSNGSETLFQIDFHYLRNSKNSSLIFNVSTKNAKILAKEKALRMNNNTIPPPPPKLKNR